MPIMNVNNNEYYYFMKCLMTASWASCMSKKYLNTNNVNLKPLLDLCIDNLTNLQKTYIVNHYSLHFPYIVEKILKETRIKYDRVVFDLRWIRNAICQNKVSVLIERCPIFFNCNGVFY